MQSGDGRGQHGFAGSQWGGVQTGHSHMPFYPVEWVLPLVMLMEICCINGIKRVTLH